MTNETPVRSGGGGGVELHYELDRSQLIEELQVTRNTPAPPMDTDMSRRIIDIDGATCL